MKLLYINYITILLVIVAMFISCSKFEDNSVLEGTWILKNYEAKVESTSDDLTKKIEKSVINAYPLAGTIFKFNTNGTVIIYPEEDLDKKGYTGNYLYKDNILTISLSDNIYKVTVLENTLKIEEDITVHYNNTQDLLSSKSTPNITKVVRIYNLARQ